MKNNFIDRIEKNPKRKSKKETEIQRGSFYRSEKNYSQHHLDNLDKRYYDDLSSVMEYLDGLSIIVAKRKNDSLLFLSLCYLLLMYDLCVEV